MTRDPTEIKCVRGANDPRWAMNNCDILPIYNLKTLAPGEVAPKLYDSTAVMEFSISSLTLMPRVFQDRYWGAAIFNLP